MNDTIKGTLASGNSTQALIEHDHGMKIINWLSQPVTILPTADYDAMVAKLARVEALRKDWYQWSRLVAQNPQDWDERAANMHDRNLRELTRALAPEQEGKS